jgi:hypothetical protein
MILQSASLGEEGPIFGMVCCAVLQAAANRALSLLLLCYRGADGFSLLALHSLSPQSYYAGLATPAPPMLFSYQLLIMGWNILILRYVRASDFEQSSFSFSPFHLIFILFK